MEQYYQATSYKARQQDPCRKYTNLGAKKVPYFCWRALQYKLYLKISNQLLGIVDTLVERLPCHGNLDKFLHLQNISFCNHRIHVSLQWLSESKFKNKHVCYCQVFLKEWVQAWNCSNIEYMKWYIPKRLPAVTTFFWVQSSVNRILSRR